jgi:protein-export membrane protein SecD
LGVTEPVVQTTQVGNDYRIIVELPGVTDVNQAIQMIGKTPVLEFKEQNNEPPRELTPEEQKQLAAYNAEVQKKSQAALQALKKGTKFEDLVVQYSQDESTKQKGGDLGFITRDVYPELFTWAKNHKDGEVSQELVKTEGGLNIVKRIAEKDMGQKVVSLSHILICYKGASNCETGTLTKEQAKAKLEEVKKEATAANFADLAKKYSTDPGNASRGGDLGQPLKRGDTVKEFEDPVWDAPVGSIVGPVETQFGFHLIYKKGEEPLKEYHVARIFFDTKEKTDIVPAQSEWKNTGLSGKQLKRAEVVQDPQTGQVQVSLKFDDEGTKLFADITSRNVGKPVAIFLDNDIISAPNVQSAILSGDAVINGSFTIPQAQQLSQQLNLGALPVPVELLSQEKVDATLGADSLRKSLQAGIYGLIAVMIFMIIYYRLPGFLSVFSLAFYALLSLALFKLMGVTLTLSGIAGFILSIGMAVDANVLVFERLKEELHLGKSLHTASEESFSRSWPSIRDGHVTALISCVFLMWFGSGFVQGFAVILAVGTIINLFTAITVTRTIMRFVFAKFKSVHRSLFLGHQSSSK